MKEVSEQQLVEQRVLSPYDFHSHIERIVEVAEYELERPASLTEQLDKIAQTLLVPPDLVQAAASALLAGHLILQGPPGTGKSSLARALAAAFGCRLMSVTAHEEWSAYEVIGRQELSVDSDQRESIVPVNGFFSEAVVECAGLISQHDAYPSQPQAAWLMIDELNRAHPDRAFAELFSVLGTDDAVPIILPHQPPGNRELVTPRRFRLVATINSVDKQFVNSLGQGIKRRFTFVTVDIPPPLKVGESYGSESSDPSLGSREFGVVLEAAKRRVVRRVTSQGSKPEDVRTAVDSVFNDLRSSCQKLFEVIATVRYATEKNEVPYVPIGTAQMIDTVELAALRLIGLDTATQDAGSAIDWAASVKLAPLFDADLRPDLIRTFAASLGGPFDNGLKRELLQIVSSGLYYVE